MEVEITVGVDSELGTDPFIWSDHSNFWSGIRWGRRAKCTWSGYSPSRIINAWMWNKHETDKKLAAVEVVVNYCQKNLTRYNAPSCCLPQGKGQLLWPVTHVRVGPSPPPPLPPPRTVYNFWVYKNLSEICCEKLCWCRKVLIQHTTDALHTSRKINNWDWLFWVFVQCHLKWEPFLLSDGWGGMPCLLRPKSTFILHFCIVIPVKVHLSHKPFHVCVHKALLFWQC